MRLFLFVFLTAAFSFFYLGSTAQDIRFSVVTPAKDDPGSSVKAMTQDAQGFLWFATTNGLYKYDGHQYTSYQNEPFNSNSPAAENTESIIADNKGNIWLALYCAGLDRLDPATGKFTHFRHHNSEPGSLISDTVWVVMQDREGTIWVGTDRGLEKFDSNTNTFIHYRYNPTDQSSLSCNEVRAIYEDKQGTLWIGTGSSFFLDNRKTEGGLNKLDKRTGRFTRYMHDEKNPQTIIDNRVRSIFEDSRGIFWIGTAGDGLHTMDRSTGIFERHQYDPLHPEKLSRPPIKKTISYGFDHITFITEDSKGRIWIGTFQGGINVYDPSTKNTTHYGSDASGNEKIKEDNFWSACKTRDSILWIGSFENELYKIKPYQNIVPHTSLGKQAFYFAEDDAHGLWITTLSGLIHKSNDGKEEQILADKDPASPANQFLFIEKNGIKFWLTSSAGLDLFDPATKSFSHYYHEKNNPNSLISDSVITVKQDDANTVWISTAMGLDRMDEKTGKFTHFQNSATDSGSISNNQVLSVAIDRHQYVWVCTNKGLNRLDRETGRFKRYLVLNSVFNLIEDKAGELWAAADIGLFRYDKEADNFFLFNDGASNLTSANLFWITEDHEQNLWCSSTKGILRLNKERNVITSYGKNQGVNAAYLTGGYTRQNGEVLFGDISGYFDFQPGQLAKNVSAPIVIIGDFLLNNISIQPTAKGILSDPLMETKEITLGHDQNTFSFQFTSIDFSSEYEDTRLVFMLEDYDNAWRKVGEERTAYYFNLPPGKYTFKIKAINAAGIASEKDIDVMITPPWWKTWWAYSIFILSGAALMWMFILYRSGKLKKENKILEEKVQHRTAELNQSLKNLKDTQTQLIQSEKMASLGELTAGIAHEIQNPLNFVNNFSEVNTELLEEVGREMDKGNITEAKTILNDVIENEQKINHHGKRADSIVKGMLQHSRSGSGQKELTDINALADEYIRLSYQGFRAKDKSFNTKIETNFDNYLSSEKGKINIVPQDISRVLVNLYNNAFYAVNERKIQQPVGYEPLVSLSTKRVGDRVEITLRDNGNGIPQKIADKIFQPFFTTKPTGQGTGLGLSLSYDIIKAHGGEIKVESKEDEGTMFVIQIPV